MAADTWKLFPESDRLWRWCVSGKRDFLYGSGRSTGFFISQGTGRGCAQAGRDRSEPSDCCHMDHADPEAVSEGDRGDPGAPCAGSLRDDRAFDGQGGSGEAGAESGAAEDDPAVKTPDERGRAGYGPPDRETGGGRDCEEAESGYQKITAWKN